MPRAQLGRPQIERQRAPSTSGDRPLVAKDAAPFDGLVDDTLRALSARQGGYFTRAQAIDAGFQDAHLRQFVRRREIERLRHGIYAFTDLLAGLSADERHRLIGWSVVDKLGPHVALSHGTACAAWGIDRYGVSDDLVHVTRLDGKPGRREAGVVYHVGKALTDDDVRIVDGRAVVLPVRAVLEVACTTSVESGVVAASSALHAELTTRDELTDVANGVRRWPGARRALVTVRLADGRCESVGESRSLFFCFREDLPKPDLQVEIDLEDGSTVRSDFAWMAYRHLGEFDGLVKYGRLNRFSDDLGKALIHEKLREDMIRAQGFGLSRWVWHDLARNRSAVTAHRIREGLERSRRLYVGGHTITPFDD